MVCIYLNLKIVYLITAHSPDKNGIFVDEHTGEDLEWFSPRWSCGNDNMNAYGGDAFEMAIFGNYPRRNGHWCDYPKSSARRFICKGVITPKE